MVSDANAQQVRSCRTCNSTKLDRLPANQMSRRPGFVCLECGTTMRDRNSAWRYIALLMFSLSLLVVTFGLTRSYFWLCICLLTAGWSIRQLLLPTVNYAA